MQNDENVTPLSDSGNVTEIGLLENPVTITQESVSTLSGEIEQEAKAEDFSADQSSAIKVVTDNLKEERDFKTLETDNSEIAIKRRVYVDGLTPFKKQIGLLLLAGLAPKEVAFKLATENQKTQHTYMSFTTMVVMGLKKLEN